MLAPVLRSTIYVLLLTVTASIVTAESPAQNNYTVTNGNKITCVVMTAAMQLTIPYIGNTQNKTASIDIPHNATSSGTCNNTSGENTLSIHFNDGWKMAVIFRSSDVNQSLYHWAHIGLEYALDSRYFPDVKNTSVGRRHCVTTPLENTTFSASQGGSYSCDAPPILQLNDSITLQVSNLQYRAFGDSNTTWFSGNDVTSCPEEEVPHVDVAVAVSVGIALGAMIVVVIVLYLVVSTVIHRHSRRNKMV